MESQHYCGIDFHKKFSAVCVMDEEGQVIEQRRVSHQGGQFEAYFGSRDPMECVIEPVEHWGWAVDSLQELGHQVHLANTYKVRLIAESRTKTDKVDARVLADLLRAGYLPEGYVASLTTRDARTYYRYRIKLARQRAQLKNQVKRLLRLENVSEPGYRDTFGKQGRVWLKQVELRPVHQRIKQEMMAVMEHYDELIRQMDREIWKRGRTDPAVQRLMTIPGIGQLTAQVILAEVGDMKRFPTDKKFVGYTGLGISERSSGGKIRHGGIAKQGNTHIRWLLVEAAHKAKCSDPNLKRYFDRIAYRRGRNKATVALARKLAKICWYLIVKEESYDSKRVLSRFG